MSRSPSEVFLSFTEIAEYGDMPMFVRADTLIAFAAVPDGGSRLHIVQSGVHLSPVVRQSVGDVGSRVMRCLRETEPE